MWSGSFVQVDNALSSATNGQPNATPAVGLLGGNGVLLRVGRGGQAARNACPQNQG